MDRECRRVTAGRGLQRKDEFAYLGTILDVRFEYTSPLLEFIEYKEVLPGASEIPGSNFGRNFFERAELATKQATFVLKQINLFACIPMAYCATT
jgi:hypothetical protein